jgi:hypothetical protein
MFTRYTGADRLFDRWLYPELPSRVPEVPKVADVLTAVAQILEPGQEAIVIGATEADVKAAGLEVGPLTSNDCIHCRKPR